MKDINKMTFQEFCDLDIKDLRKIDLSLRLAIFEMIGFSLDYPMNLTALKIKAREGVKA